MSIIVDFFFKPLVLSVCMTAIYLVWSIVWKKIDLHHLENVATMLFCIMAAYMLILFVNSDYVLRTWGVIYTLKILIPLLAVWMVHYIGMRISDYLMVSVFLVVLNRLLLSNSIIFLAGWMLLCVVTTRRMGKLHNYTVQVLLSFVSYAFTYFLYEFLLNQNIIEYYYEYSKAHQLSRFGKGLFLLLVSLFLLLILGGVMLLMKRIFRFYFERLNEFSNKYKEINQYLLLIPYLLCILLFIIEIMSEFEYIDGYQTDRVISLMSIMLLLFFIGTQIFYLVLLAKTIRLKEHLEFKETEQENLKLYNEDVKKNMIAIREMKHDLKNIFLTMGEYVARSNDQEMQNYYYEKIAPYAQNEIRMNDVYVSLQNINNEPIRAFLYYKLMQGMDSKIAIQLETQSDNSVLGYLADVSVITRILGIFIDNAMEESLKVGERGFVHISVHEKNGQVGISVKNPVRESVKEQWIRIGVSQKGLGRGNGLVIVDKLIKKNKNLIWNSYFKENVYGQTLLILRPERS
ncbi:histidine kinase [Lachnospiraceae bacterium KM106-2]|nr:histidine kinase [Lachnospiraceae bacterium KM106-2]